MADSKVPANYGFGRSDKHTFTIPSGQTAVSDSEYFRLDLGRPYSFHVIRIEDCTGFDSDTILYCKVANDDTPAQFMADLYETNRPDLKWGYVMPTTGTLQMLLTHTFGARYIKFYTNKVTDGNIEIDIYGYDPTVIYSDNGV